LTGLILFACCSNKKIPDEKTLLSQAKAFESSQLYEKALESYLMLVDNYPKSPQRYQALFMAGYIKSEFLKDNKGAVKLFDQLIKEYPDCDLADDASQMSKLASTGKDLMSVLEDSLKNK
jgi:TolA-binding protein